MRSGICNCLAIYDWCRDITPVRFHEIATALFNANGVIPDTASITPTGAERNDVQEYSRAVAALPTLRGGVDFLHTIPGYKQLTFGWDACASLHTDRDKTMLFCFAQNLANLDVGYFERIVRTLAAEVDLKYGIGYQRDFELGPDMYAHGMVSGLGYSPRDIAEADRIGAWMQERPGASRHLHGCLRDVYPLNILSTRHLSRDVGKLSLEQWIQQATDRGQLVQLNNGASLWIIPDRHIADVQAKLQQAGCIIVPPTVAEL
jgi:hypothetical protein